ncbi:RbsD/FucU domain-containing protein [Nocardioides sp.]|uniref:RbsD/FucU family protein n=1 Tax=Nocardioides sp. TaxID=35761 RepID=UPI00261FDCF0|nr:RbsD/FucU domain-containing protein [Nocardioides sp.]MDI6909600.1 RbsD/FucU domain-containing protein [Nocardioides sp.]
MLKNIDPLLNADLLGHLAAMGHGDVLAIVDRNFPAASTAERLVTLSGVDVPAAARAILTVFPVDAFVEPAVLRMGAVGDEDRVQPVHADLQAEVDAAEGRAVASAAVDRFEFYRRAAEAYLVVATAEARPYGCFLLAKGVV